MLGKTQKGFTLIELMICLVILLVIGGVAFTAYEGITGLSNKTATDAAQHWAMNVTPANSTSTVECANYDSDGDGYVSCTVFVHQEDGQVETHGIECAGYFTFNKGCRIPKAVLRQRR